MKQDSAWKEVVEDLFEGFLFFFFPHIHKFIDLIIDLPATLDAKIHEKVKKLEEG